MAVLLAAWWWPTLTRDPDRVDVAVIGDRDVRDAADEIARNVRQRGLGVVVDSVDTPCDAQQWAATANNARQVVLVFSRAETEQCDGNFELVTASFDAVMRVSLDDHRLVQAGSSVRLGCEWWEPQPPAVAIANCEADGLITVRDETGSLTIAGRDRVGRVLAGVLP